MKIESYHFGVIEIDGKRFFQDVVIRKEKIEKWWRKESHNVVMDDIEKFLQPDTKTVIFGKGAFGIMKISQAVREELNRRNIEIIEEKTGKAVEIFNSMSDKSRVVAFFHLTC